jgi:hypothetical protein
MKLEVFQLVDRAQAWACGVRARARHLLDHRAKGLSVDSIRLAFLVKRAAGARWRAALASAFHQARPQAAGGVQVQIIGCSESL